MRVFFCFRVINAHLKQATKSVATKRTSAQMDSTNGYPFEPQSDKAKKYQLSTTVHSSVPPSSRAPFIPMACSLPVNATAGAPETLQKFSEIVMSPKTASKFQSNSYSYVESDQVMNNYTQGSSQLFTMYEQNPSVNQMILPFEDINNKNAELTRRLMLLENKVSSLETSIKDLADSQAARLNKFEIILCQILTAVSTNYGERAKNDDNGLVEVEEAVSRISLPLNGLASFTRWDQMLNEDEDYFRNLLTHFGKVYGNDGKTTSRTLNHITPLIIINHHHSDFLDRGV